MGVAEEEVVADVEAEAIEMTVTVAQAKRKHKVLVQVFPERNFEFWTC